MNISFDTDNNENAKDMLSQSSKDSNKQQWYKDKIDHYQGRTSSSGVQSASSDSFDTRFKNKKENYDLFNNIINLDKFKSVTNPYGDSAGKLPANMVNRDIVSSKIKVLLGMESDMPFSWKVAAVNEEATTRREQEEFKRIKDYVISTIMTPIQQEIELKYAQQSAGRELSPDEQKQIQDQVQKDLAAQTPDEVYRYMKREHQDPAEVLMHQLLTYIYKKENLPEKFNRGWKHAAIGGTEVYWVGITNGEPVVKVINDMRFDYDRSTESQMIEDGEWAVANHRWTPTKILKELGSELTNDELKRVFEAYSSPSSALYNDWSFDDNYEDSNSYTIEVVHANWIGMRKIGFLSYHDYGTGRIESMMVPESYRFNKELGDIKIEWEWIPEAHEGYKIMLPEPIYVRCRPVPGQHKDLDDLYTSKLSYYGASLDAMNSIPTSPMDRMKNYQIYYDIILYRVDMLMASDKGKILMMNLNMIPKTAGIDTAKFMYFMEANKIGFFNPAEEGNKLIDSSVGNVAKEIDMSLASDIMKYIELAEYIERRCGESVGINKNMEGLASPNEAVTNARQNITQSSYILRPYFELHNLVKANVLQAVVDKAKVAYAGGKQRKLAYVLDDMSLEILKTDPDLLDGSSYGIFVQNAVGAYEAKQMVMNMAQAALQTQRADISDIIKIMNSDSLQQSQEMLEAAELRADERIRRQQAEQLQFEEKQSALLREQETRVFNQEKELIVLKERERRETELAKQAMLSLGFNEDKDTDNDGELDVLEVYKAASKAKLDTLKLKMDADKLQHQKIIDKKKLEQGDKKLEIDKKKANKPPTSK